MPHRPDDDPQRPLRFAIRSTRLLGIVSAAFGLVFTIAFGYFNKYRTYRLHFIAMGLIVWFIPGVLFITFASMMKQGRHRGAVGAIAIAITQGLFALAALAGSILLPPVSAIPILLSLLWAASIVQLLLHLSQSIRLLEKDVSGRHGFDLSAPQPVLPADDSVEQR
jgi:hypothetical protein